MNTTQIYQHLNGLYDFKNQDEWDNSNYYIINDNDVENVIICLDITPNILQIAIDNNVDLIISHHPFLVKDEDQTNFHRRKLLGKIINNNINIITLHTPFDKSIYGMNIALANKLGLKSIHSCKDPYVMIGEIEDPIPLKEVAKLAKQKLNSSTCSYLERYEDKMVQKIAICGGSGFSCIFNLNHKEFDVFITCDLKHHNWVDSVEINAPIICLNHNIENIFIDVIINKLQPLMPNTNFIKAKSSLKMKHI